MKLSGEVGNVQLMQRINRLKVLEVIRGKGPLARPQIAALTGLSSSSVTNIVSYLLERDLAEETGTVDSREVGRKATLIRFKPSAYRIVAVIMEPTRVDFALTDLDGSVLLMRRSALEGPPDGDEALGRVKDGIARLLEESRGGGSGVVGIGVAVSALVQDEGRFVLSTSLRWKGLSIRARLEEGFGLPVFILNYSRAKALWALKTNVEESDRNVVFLDLAMGVGIVSVFEHRINEAVIGELGHTTVCPDGPQCFCGNRGCLEMMCSAEAVLRRCEALLERGRCPVLRGLLGEPGGALDYGAVLKAFELGDGGVREALGECGRYLGIGLANIINLFNPQRIVINGDALLQSDYLYETALAEANARANEHLLQGLKYRKIAVGPRESIQGVSAYVTERLLELPDSLL